MGYIRVDYDIFGSRSKDNIHFSPSNIVETVGSDGRGGYRSHTSHSYSHNPGVHGRLLSIPGSYRHVDDSIQKN